VFTEVIVNSLSVAIIMLTAEQPTKLVGRKPSSSARKTPSKKSGQQVPPDSVCATNQSPFQALELEDIIKDNTETFRRLSSPSSKTSPADSSRTNTTVPTKQRRIAPPGAPAREAQPSQKPSAQTSPTQSSQVTADQRALSDFIPPGSTRSGQPTSADQKTQTSQAPSTKPSQTCTPQPTHRHFKSCRVAWERQVLMSFQNLFNKEETSDVIILLGNERIYAHRLILNVNSKLLLSQTESLHNIEVCAVYG
jgi:hypothetical protein